jgi:hypothetical protein
MSQGFKFVIKLSEASAGLLMLMLEGSQVIGPPHEVGVDGVGLPLDLLTEVLLFPKFGKQAFLLAFKSVQLFSKFLI